MEVINLPIGDERVGVFAAKLQEFIVTEGDGLPFPSVLGAIDIVKFKIMLKQDEE